MATHIKGAASLIITDLIEDSLELLNLLDFKSFWLKENKEYSKASQEGKNEFIWAIIDLNDRLYKKYEFVKSKFEFKEDEVSQHPKLKHYQELIDMNPPLLDGFPSLEVAFKTTGDFMLIFQLVKMNKFLALVINKNPETKI